MFGGNFAPKGWALCDGQLLPISQNTALFSLLGTFYGGDGKSTFALPNLQGSAALGQGQRSGLSNYCIGKKSGTKTVPLLQTEMPAHIHNLQGQNAHLGTLPAATPSEAPAKSAGGNSYTDQTTNIVQMNPQSLGVVGSSFPHNNMQPYLCVVFIIAQQGIFPPRS